MARGEVSHEAVDKAANGAANGNGAPVEPEAVEAYTPDPDVSMDDAHVEPSEVVPVEEATVSADAVAPPEDIDPAETQEWLESFRYVLESKGPERVSYLLVRARRKGPSLGRRVAVHGHHALHQYHPRRGPAPLSRQPRD